MIGYVRIRKRDFYRNGGLSNPRNVRVTRSNTWAYFYRVD